MPILNKQDMHKIYKVKGFQIKNGIIKYCYYNFSLLNYMLESEPSLDEY